MPCAPALRICAAHLQVSLLTSQWRGQHRFGQALPAGDNVMVDAIEIQEYQDVVVAESCFMPGLEIGVRI